MSSGIHGHGTTLKWGAGPTSVVEVLSIGGPEQAADVLDVTNMDSATKTAEKIKGMLDAGEISFELNYVKAQAATLQGKLGGAAETWLITLPDASTYSCSGFISSLGTQIPFDDKITQSCTITLTGAMTDA